MFGASGHWRGLWRRGDTGWANDARGRPGPISPIDGPKGGGFLRGPWEQTPFRKGIGGLNSFPWVGLTGRKELPLARALAFEGQQAQLRRNPGAKLLGVLGGHPGSLDSRREGAGSILGIPVDDWWLRQALALFTQFPAHRRTVYRLFHANPVALLLRVPVPSTRYRLRPRGTRYGDCSQPNIHPLPGVFATFWLPFRGRWAQAPGTCPPVVNECLRAWVRNSPAGKCRLKPPVGILVCLGLRENARAGPLDLRARDSWNPTFWSYIPGSQRPWTPLGRNGATRGILNVGFPVV